MDKMTEYLMRAARELGLTITAPFRCDVDDETEVWAVAHLPELGGVNGTLVFTSDQFDRRVFGFLKGRGFACSSFDEPLDSEEYDIQGCRELFADWGWSSARRDAPPWIVQSEFEGE